MLIVLRTLREQIVILHRRLLAVVRDDEVCRRLMTTPSVARMLYEAAQSMLRSKKWSWLKAWAMQIARRRGIKKAIVALVGLNSRAVGAILHNAHLPDKLRCANESHRFPEARQRHHREREKHSRLDLPL